MSCRLVNNLFCGSCLTLVMNSWHSNSCATMKISSAAFLNVPVPPGSNFCQSSKDAPALITLMCHLHTWTLGLKLTWDSPRRGPDRVSLCWVLNLGSCLPLSARGPLCFCRQTFDELMAIAMGLRVSGQGVIWAPPLLFLCAPLWVCRQAFVT